jgi:hypothetical protein
MFSVRSAQRQYNATLVIFGVQNSVRVRLHNQIMQETGRITKIQMYVQLDKEKPGIGNIGGLNLAAVKSTTVLVSDCLF